MCLSTLADRGYQAAAKLGIQLVTLLVLSPLFALYGLFMIVAALRSLLHNLGAMKRLSGTTVTCPHCAHPNPLADRWRCGKCKAEYHGFVGSCPFCKSTARAFSCARCRITIPLGLD